MKRIGVVVNPIAGMGGRVGLKGTDDKLEAARNRGAEPRAPDRAAEALAALHRRDPDVEVLVAGGSMGADQARAAGIEPDVVFSPDADDWTETTAGDTREAVRTFLERDVDLVLFVGGDGTAVDVATVLEEWAAGEGGTVGGEDGAEGEDGGGGGEAEGSRDEAESPMLGVPAGVKVYSSVFAVTPAEAGRIAAEFDRVERREVNDIDEEAYREGEVRAQLRAVVPVPVAPGLQASKQVASGNVESLAAGFAREVDPDAVYVFGPGSTVGAIEAELGIDASPLGVDVWRDGSMLARDAAEADVLAAIDEVERGLRSAADASPPVGSTTNASPREDSPRDGSSGTNEPPVVIVVSPIGGQGFVFGRGNHQLSPTVIERATDVEVVASGAKLDELDALRVDTDDPELDDELRGWRRVRTGRFTTRMMKIV